MQRLPLSDWKNIFRNLEEESEEVDILWLDGTNEWVLCHRHNELFEDGFSSELEAQQRLDEIERQLQAEEEEHTNDNMSSRERAMYEAGHKEIDFL